MKRRRLIVFAGKPGIGKSAIIARIGDGYEIVDVWPFLVKYIEPGKDVPSEEKNIFGYQDMYRHIAGLNDRDVLLEIGTNYPDTNIQEIEKLAEKYDVEIFLCNAPVELIRERGKARGYRYNESFELRLKRDFPNTYLRELKKTALKHQVLNMEGTIEDVLVRIKQLLENRS